MVKSDGTVILDTRIDTNGIDKGMKTIDGKVSGLINSFKKLGIALGSAFTVKKLVEFGNKFIELGSDLQEVQNVVDVTFTTMSDKVGEFAKKASASAGLSETMAKRYAGTFGAMAKAFGFAEEESFMMSTALTQLAGDVASFYNITQDEAYTKLKSVFTGETESLKELGVVMTQTALDSFALSEGIGKTTKQMTEQEKVSLRYRFVMSQLSGASGDFAINLDSWANQMRILKLNMETIMATVGQALINFFTPILKLINVVLAKIATLASSFQSFSELIMGKKATKSSLGKTASELSDINDGFSGASDSMDKMAESTKKAEKANKKYLTGLDEIRTFTAEDTSAEMGDISAGGGTVIDFASVETGSEVLEETNGKLNGLIERMKELVGLFKKGFADGLGDVSSRVDTIKKAVASIKESMADIFDKEVATSFNEMLDTIAYSLGQITGAFASVGLSIGANLTGGIAKYLESDKGRIKQYLLNMFDIVGEIMSQAGAFADAFAYVFEVISSESGQQITADIFGIFSEAFMGITELFARFSLDFFTAFTQPFIDAKDTLKSAIQDLLDGVATVTSTLNNIFSDVIQQVLALYEQTIAPVLDNLQSRMTELYENHLAPLFTQIGELLTALGEAVQLLWDEVLKPLIDWIIQNIAPVIVPIINTVFNVASTVIMGVLDLIMGLMQVLEGLINFVTGIFTGNWEKAWNGIKDVFAGVINTMTSIIETFANGVIGLINGVIGAFNTLTGIFSTVSIPTIPEVNIPKLATGAVIPPNAPFVAMLGDQKRGTNIEAPLDTIKQAVREVVGSGTVGGTYQFIAQLDGRTIFESVISEAQLRQSSTGQNKLVTL